MFVKPVVIFLIFFSTKAYGEELYQVYRSTRAMGMGGAYTSVVAGADSVFYNPASLSSVKGLNISLLNANASISDVDENVLDSLSELQDSDQIVGALNSLFGTPVAGGASARLGVVLPGFALIGFGNFDASIVVNNPVVPDLEVNSILDVGGAIGVSHSFSRYMQVGVVFKHFTRYGDRTRFTANSITELDPDQITDQLEKKGRGYSLDVGMDLLRPSGNVRPKISAVIKNIGNTKFERGNTSAGPPPGEEQEFVFSGALVYDFPLVTMTLAGDYRYALNSDIDDARKVNAGLEISLPLLDLRGGMHQGYLTYGVGLNLGLFKINAASYGVELGARSGQSEDRRYSANVIFEFGYDFLGGRQDSKHRPGLVNSLKASVDAALNGKVRMGESGGRKSVYRKKRKFYRKAYKQRR